MLREKRKKLKNKKNEKEEISFAEKKAKIRKFSFFVLLIFFIGLSFWLLFFSSFVRINNIKIVGFQEDLVREMVQTIANSSYLGVIPQNNILLLPSSEIERKIKDNLILAQDIKVKKVFPDTIEVFFDERENVIIWCQENPDQKCFLIDENGEAFYQANENDNFKEIFPVIFSKGTLDIEIGKIIIKPELAKFCSEISGFSQKEAGVELHNEYYTPSFMSGEIRVSTEQGWSIYFNSFSTAYEQSKLLKSFLDKNKEEENFNELEYIDLRLDGKVLYKLKESEKIEDEIKEEKDLSEE